MKRALITGITGQDGAYLARFLLGKGYRVFGAYRRTSTLDTSRLARLGLADEVTLVPFELLEFTNVLRTVEKVSPDEVYNLAAQSFVAVSFDQPLFTADVTALGPLRILEALRTVNPGVRFYQASTSEMFGRVHEEVPQTERTRFHPRSPYGLAKLFAHWATVNYRESYGMFACAGILFNHESPLRGLEFVTRKISRTAARIRFGLEDRLLLGNLDAVRDWGYAPEYVETMWLMLQRPTADDYVVATGESHSVREFADVAFRCAGMEVVWEGTGADEQGRDRRTGRVVVSIDPDLYRPAEVDHLRGDPAKARAHLGWAPKTLFPDLVRVMTEADLSDVGRLTARGS